MYIFNEKFNLTNDINMPYSLTEENLYPYTSESGWVEEGKFIFAREDTRFILKTPMLKNFDFSCKMEFMSPMTLYRRHTSWGICFGYDPAKRSGKLLEMKYLADSKTLCTKLYDFCGKNKNLICEDIAENITLEANIAYELKLSVKDGNCTGAFANMDFEFECGIVEGKIAISNIESIKSLIFSDLYVESDDVDYEIVMDRNYIIPHYDGGNENYNVNILVKKYSGGIYDISYELTGGACRKTDDYKMAVWAIQYDIFTDAYIRFCGKNNTDKLYLKNGELIFVEQNEKLIATNLLLNGETMPYKGSFQIEEFDVNSDFVFGYDHFRNYGNELQEGRREFVYREDELIYSGMPLTDDCVIKVESPVNKKITERIPENIDKYDYALFHAQNNHYFMYDEDVQFKVTAYVKNNSDLITSKVQILDAFFEEIKTVNTTFVPSDDLAEYGFSALEYNVNLGKMEQGIYHIKTDVVLGNEILLSHTSAFEVFDESEKSPRESSGIPFMYSGDGAPINVEYNCPDPWLIKPDHNEVHYLDCMLAVPEVTEGRKGWELLALYKRKMFLWADERTIPSGKTFEDYPNSIKYADYISINDASTPLPYYRPFRRTFENAEIRKIYNDFKEDHKDYDLFEMPEDGKVSEQVHIDFFKRYGTEWLAYMGEKNAQNIINLYGDIKRKYPDLKFSHYGPYNVYTTRHSGIRRTNMSYAPYKHAAKIMDGFWYFEDYPFITGVATHYSAWSMMGLLLNMPDANVVVELYGSFDPVCPDGLVMLPNPPLGGVYVESYRTVTQVYEHMYAAVLSGGDFKYYNKPGFQFYQLYNTEASKRFEEFLKGWGTYLKNKPLKPLKSPAFVAEFPDEDDRFDFDFSERDANNISQAGQAYLYEVMAEAGLPKGFCTNLDGVLDIDENLTDVCIIPSLKHTSDNVKQKIRKLSEKGVALIAVSDVCDLCDLFGVKEDKNSAKVAALETGDEFEYITHRNAEFPYVENGAEVALYVVAEDGKKYPFVLKYGKNILINSYICHIGCAETRHDTFGISNVSKLLRKVLTKLTTEVSNPLATADNNCGLNLFVNENGEKRILLTDFTLCGSCESKRVTVKLNFDVDDIVNVCHKDMAVEPNVIRVDGKIKAFTVTFRPGESALFAIK